MAEALALTEGLSIMFRKEVKTNSTPTTWSESTISDMMSIRVLAADLNSSSDVSGLEGLALEA
jgi:hypothetical protein